MGKETRLVGVLATLEGLMRRRNEGGNQAVEKSWAPNTSGTRGAVCSRRLRVMLVVLEGVVAVEQALAAVPLARSLFVEC
jgi:hypothetical protein